MRSPEGRPGLALAGLALLSYDCLACCCHGLLELCLTDVAASAWSDPPWMPTFRQSSERIACESAVLSGILTYTAAGSMHALQCAESL